MNKKIIYGLIAVLVAALALFVGLFVGITKENKDSNNNYVAPSVIDKTDVLIDPYLGTVDYDNLEGETYYLKANNLTTENSKYFYNNNPEFYETVQISERQTESLLSSTYAGDVSETFFITVEELGSSKTESSLVYIKFSTYLGKYDINGELLGTEPAAVVFGYERTPENVFILRYSFCTYSDRGDVTSYLKLGDMFNGSELGFAVTMRIPYLLTSNYENTLKLFDINGLEINGITYKLLNNATDQLYIESNPLSVITSLTKYVYGSELSLKDNTTVLKDFLLSKYIKVVGQEDSNIVSSLTFNKGILMFDNFKYFETLTAGVVTFLPITSLFNNSDSIYNVQLDSVNV